MPLSEETDSRTAKGNRIPGPKKVVTTSSVDWETIGWCTVMTVGGALAIVILAADDATLVGIADDALIPIIGGEVVLSAKKLFEVLA